MLRAGDTDSKLCSWLLAVVCFLALIGAGCRRTPEATLRALDGAEAVIEAQPDSALTLLESIDTLTLRTAADRARHSLLLTMALDKNWIDIIDMKILKPALDYYLKHGTAAQRLNTRYYQGRIFLNQGKKVEALKSFIEASADTADCRDSLALGRLLTAQGRMYWEESAFKEYMECNTRAANIYLDLGDSLRYYDCLGRVLDGSYRNMDAKNRLRLLEKCLQGIDSYRAELPALKVYVTNAFPDLLPKSQFDRYVASLEQDSVEIPTLETALAFAYCQYGDMEKARTHIEKGDPNDTTFYYSNKSEILENLGDTVGALEAYKTYLRGQENSLQEDFDSQLLFTRQRHELEEDAQNKISRREGMLYWAGAVLLLLAIGIVIIYLGYRYNRLKRKNEEQINKELLSDNSHLKKEKHSLEKDKVSLKEANKSLKGERDILKDERDALEEVKITLEEEKNTLEEEKTSLNNDLQAAHADLAYLTKELEKEQEHLMKVLAENSRISDKISGLIRHRVRLLNGILGREISGPNEYSRKFDGLVKTIHDDKNGFLKKIRKDYAQSHPEFMDCLEKHGLTEREQNICCLYTLGLSGKEIGSYIGISNIYKLTGPIRQKFNLPSGSEDLDVYIMSLFEKI